MTDTTQGAGTVGSEDTLLIRGEEGVYAVPTAVLERHRIPPERESEAEAVLRTREFGEDMPATPLYELPRETLAAYRLSDDEWAALEARRAERGNDDARGFGPPPSVYPISGYTGYHYDQFFGGFARDGSGHSVYIGVFPKYRAPAGQGPYPGLH